MRGHYADVRSGFFALHQSSSAKGVDLRCFWLENAKNAPKTGQKFQILFTNE